MTTITELAPLTLDEIQGHIDFMRPQDCDHGVRGIEYYFSPHQIELARELLNRQDFKKSVVANGCHAILKGLVTEAIDYADRPVVT